MLTQSVLWQRLPLSLRLSSLFNGSLKPSATSAKRSTYIHRNARRTSFQSSRIWKTIALSRPLTRFCSSPHRAYSHCHEKYSHAADSQYSESLFILVSYTVFCARSLCSIHDQTDNFADKKLFLKKKVGRL